MGDREFGAAIDLAVATAMASDPSVVVFGEDTPMLRRDLLARFGPERVRGTPISESGFLGLAVGAAMEGLRPVVEIQLVDFVTVGLSALVNEAAKISSFSGGRCAVPLVVRATCGGGYGDGGQHEQALWGLLSGIPGLNVVVPSCPADAAGLMLSAIVCDEPVVFLEHKLLSKLWLDVMGGDSRPTVEFDVPPEGRLGPVDDPPKPVALGSAAVARSGNDLTIVSLGVGFHRSLTAADRLADDGHSVGVVDLRSVAPLDTKAILSEATRSGSVLVVDEDYERGGLSGEVAALLMTEAAGTRFARVTTRETIPYARHLERATLPNVDRIVSAATALIRS